MLDDEGGNVSAGEKQLLTIAPAFLARPSVLILDEATSLVDTRTEMLVQKIESALRSGVTSLSSPAGSPPSATLTSSG